MQLQGAKVLVLGGSGVLGGEIALACARRGSSVLLAGRDAERLQLNATRIGANTPSVIADLTIPQHAQHVIATAVETLGGLTGVVNAAGVVAFGELSQLGDDDLDALIAVDLAGPLRVIREAIPHISGGFIVNITGVVAETPMANMAAYSAVKAALSAASAALSRELRRSNILVLDAQPPHTETGLAGRAIAGVAPVMKRGLDPVSVVERIVQGLEADERRLPAIAFTQT